MLNITSRRAAWVEALETRRLLAVSLGVNYAGTITVGKADAAVIADGARQVDFALTVTARDADGGIAGDLSAGQIGVFAFTGSLHGKDIEMVFEDESGGAGALTANLSRRGAVLSGKWLSKTAGQRVAGSVHATAGGQSVSADGIPPILGQTPSDTTASGPLAQGFTGSARIPGTAGPTSGNSSTSTSSASSPANSSSRATAAGSTGAINGTAGAIPVADSTGAIGGATGAIGGAIGTPITGATGVVGGAIAGANGAITGSMGAVTGATGAITGSTGAITGGATATPIAGSSGAITGSTGAISGSTGGVTGNVNSMTGMGSIFGLNPMPTTAPVSPTQPAPVASPTPPPAHSEAVAISVGTESADRFITGTFTLGSNVFNFDGVVIGSRFTMILSGSASGHAEGILSRNHSVFSGTFAIPDGSPSAGDFSADNRAASA